MNNSLSTALSKLNTSHFALGLICCAVVGAGVSYHLTEENRFSAIESKQEQTATTVVEIQTQQEENAAARSDDFNKLSKQVDDLKQSILPIAMATKAQGESLVDIRKQISGIETNYSTQLEKIQKEDELVLASDTAMENNDAKSGSLITSGTANTTTTTSNSDPADSGAVRALPVLPMSPTPQYPGEQRSQTPAAPRALPLTDTTPIQAEPTTTAQADNNNLPNYNLPQQ